MSTELKEGFFVLVLANLISWSLICIASGVEWIMGKNQWKETTIEQTRTQRIVIRFDPSIDTRRGWERQLCTLWTNLTHRSPVRWKIRLLYYLAYNVNVLCCRLSVSLWKEYNPQAWFMTVGGEKGGTHPFYHRWYKKQRKEKARLHNCFS